jgi:hypothetical protein
MERPGETWSPSEPKQGPEDVTSHRWKGRARKDSLFWGGTGKARKHQILPGGKGKAEKDLISDGRK